RVGVEIRVGVDEDEDLARRAPEAFGHGATLAVVATQVDGLEPGTAPAGLEDAGPCVVGRAIVDDDHLDQVARVADIEAGGARAADAFFLVEGGDDDADRWPV